MITIVSGLPRSGTSLAMQMLAAGGLPVLTDGVRSPDENNPRGFYEYSRVLQLPRGDTGWGTEAEGRAVKITWPLLRSIPATWDVRIVWMHRALDEIIASQAKMLGRTGETAADALALKRAFASMQDQARHWMATRPNTPTLLLAHDAVLRSSHVEARRLSDFCDGTLDANAMAAAVDPALWRERRPAS
jgi:hypothetical protein